MKLFAVLFLTCISNVVVVYTQYINYVQIGRKCLPFYNCPPGYEVQPCVKNFEQDMCTQCRPGYVQPDLTSSPINGNLNSTSCFKPISECLADDITFRRSAKDAFCNSMKGCKCDTTKCYFGDPCLCEFKEKGCLSGTTLDESGECVPCEAGTFKNDTGCGPCRRISYEIPGISKHMNLSTLPTALQIVQIETSSVRDTTVTEPLQIIDEDPPDQNQLLLIVLIGVLVVIIIILTLLIICVLTKKYGCISHVLFRGVCWQSSNTQQHNAMQQDRAQFIAPNGINHELVRRKNQHVLNQDRNEHEQIVPMLPLLDNHDPSVRCNQENDLNKSDHPNDVNAVEMNTNSFIISNEIEQTSLESMNKITTQDIIRKSRKNGEENDEKVDNINDSLVLSRFCNNKPKGTSLRISHTIVDTSSRQVSHDTTSGYSTQSVVASSLDQWESGTYTVNISELSSNLTENISSTLECFTYKIHGTNIMDSFSSLKKEQNSVTNLKKSCQSCFDSGFSELNLRSF